MRERILNSDKPRLDARWFWDFAYDKIDWQKSYMTVIARIIERGDESDLRELERFYGKVKIVNALKNAIVFLPDYAIEDACNRYSLRKEELLCHLRKQSKPSR